MKSVTIYSTPNCHYCHLAKDFFNEHGIKYTEYDVAADAERRMEMMQTTGQLGVPVIAIENSVMVGFNEAQLRELLEIES
jgi:glutaredoxin-like YruB-family protein